MSSNITRLDCRRLILYARRAAVQRIPTDADWRHAKLWGLVYRNEPSHDEFIAAVNDRFMHANAINSNAFPSLLRFENEIVAMAKDLFHPDSEVCGNVTSGGTESNLLALKAHRDWARAHRPEIKQPEILIPSTAHQSFWQGASYFDLKPVTVPVTKEFVVNLDKLEMACTPNTILLVASAPGMYCGTMDPIEAMGRVALANKAGLHVDAGIGGLFLAFLAKQRPVPPFDFAVPGVTSISLSLHKYGFSAKGVGLTLYRTRDLRRHQFFIDAGPSRGVHFSPGLLGTRSGGPIASAWASMKVLGQRGLQRIVTDTMLLRDKLLAAIEAIPALQIVGTPLMTVCSFGSSTLSIDGLVRRMRDRGWYLDKQLDPSSVRLIVMPIHATVLDTFVADLQQAVLDEQRDPSPPTPPRLPFVYDVPTNVVGGARSEKAIFDVIDRLYP